MKRFFYRSILLLVAILVPTGICFSGASTGQNLIIDQNYQLISKHRVSRTVYEYTYKANIINNGSNDVQNVTATVTSTDQHTTVVDGDLDFGDVAAEATVTSNDTFTIRQDRRYPINWSKLVWSIQSTSISRVIEFISANPDTVFVGEPATVTVTVQIGADPELLMDQIYLLRVDSTGNVLENYGLMYDDGTHGDSLIGDGTFTTQIQLDESGEGQVLLMVKANYSALPTIGHSEIAIIDVLKHITDEDYLKAVNMPNDVEQQYDELVAQYGEEEARNKTVEWLKQQPDIATAGISENGYGIWWVFESGILGGLMLTPGNQKGSIGSKKAINLSPYYDYFSPQDDYDGAFKELKNSECPKFISSFYLNDLASVEKFKDLSNYGVIVISSHGDNWYNGILSWWHDHFGEDIDFFENWLSQVIIYTGTEASIANKDKYEADLRKHRLVIGNGAHFCITPSFIVHYNGSFPKSLVYISSCRSLYNSTMADAFLSKGAKVYFGYTDYVQVPYAFNCGKSLFKHLVKGEKAKEAFDHTIGENGEHETHDGDTAYFKMKGDGDLTVAFKELVENGNFEKGNLSGWTTGFTVGGDFPEYSGPGGYWTAISERKYDGTYSARLGRFDQTYTQGLHGPPQPGDEPSGREWMYQDVKIPPNSHKTLSFYYKIRTYDTAVWDWFDAFIIDPDTGARLATIVSKAGKPGTDYGEYWESDWREVTYDLSPFVGQTIRIQFECREDGWGDQTAVYLDKISIPCN